MCRLQVKPLESHVSPTGENLELDLSPTGENQKKLELDLSLPVQNKPQGQLLRYFDLFPFFRLGGLLFVLGCHVARTRARTRMC